MLGVNLMKMKKEQNRVIKFISGQDKRQGFKVRHENVPPVHK